MPSRTERYGVMIGIFGPCQWTFFGAGAGFLAIDLNFLAGFAFAFAFAMVPPIMWTDILSKRRKNGIRDSHGHQVRSPGTRGRREARRHLPGQVVEPDLVPGQRLRRAPRRLRGRVPLAQARPRGRVLFRARGAALPRP